MRVDPKTYRPGRGKGKRRPPPRPGTVVATDGAGPRPPTKPTAKSGQAQPYRKAQVGTAVKPRSRTAALSAMRRGKPRYSPNPAASRNAATKRATAQRRKKRR